MPGEHALKHDQRLHLVNLPAACSKTIELAVHGAMIDSTVGHDGRFRKLHDVAGLVDIQLWTVYRANANHC